LTSARSGPKAPPRPVQDGREERPGRRRILFADKPLAPIGAETATRLGADEGARRPRIGKRRKPAPLLRFIGGGGGQRSCQTPRRRGTNQRPDRGPLRPPPVPQYPCVKKITKNYPAQQKFFSPKNTLKTLETEPIAKRQFCNSNGVGRLRRACRPYLTASGT
jgi:hypothetical protein